MNLLTPAHEEIALWHHKLHHSSQLSRQQDSPHIWDLVSHFQGTSRSRHLYQLMSGFHRDCTLVMTYLDPLNPRHLADLNPVAFVEASKIVYCCYLGGIMSSVI